MSPKLQRFRSPVGGNGLRAAAALRPGELLRAARPLASCASGRERLCHQCFTRCESLLRCSRCKLARYCDAACQRLAWPDHKRECRCLQSLRPRTPTDSVRLAARIVFALSSSSSSSSEELYTLEEHESHLASLSEQRKQGLSALASVLQLYLREAPDLSTDSLPTSCRDPLGLIAKVTCNCFTISDGELQEAGVGLYPSLSLLNHDCRPNCVAVFEGTTLLLRAVRDVSPGEELTISYIETAAPGAERRQQLEQQYHFTCRCQRCDSQGENQSLSPLLKDGLMLSGEEASWRALKEALPLLEELKAQSNWGSILERCGCLLSAAGRRVPEENVYRLRTTDMATDAAIHLQRWTEALEYGQRTLPVYRRYYPDPHPVLGIQLVRVGKLQHFLARPADALDTFRQAYSVLKVTHGDEHAVTADLLARMEACRAEALQQPPA